MDVIRTWLVLFVPVVNIRVVFDSLCGLQCSVGEQEVLSSVRDYQIPKCTGSWISEPGQQRVSGHNFWITTWNLPTKAKTRV